jgi:hypothetical protein
MVRLTLTLLRIAAVEAPVRAFALACAGVMLITVPAFAGVVAVLLFPQGDRRRERGRREWGDRAAR